MKTFIAALAHRLMHRPAPDRPMRADTARRDTSPPDEWPSMDTQPMLFRSEAFAEDLLDLHPSY